jgi:hypothetical protein
LGGKKSSRLFSGGQKEKGSRIVACGLYPLSSTWYEEAPLKIAPGNKELEAAIELKPCQYEITECWFNRLRTVAENVSRWASLFLLTLIEWEKLKSV